MGKQHTRSIGKQQTLMNLFEIKHCIVIEFEIYLNLQNYLNIIYEDNYDIHK